MQKYKWYRGRSLIRVSITIIVRLLHKVSEGCTLRVAHEKNSDKVLKCRLLQPLTLTASGSIIPNYFLVFLFLSKLWASVRLVTIFERLETYAKNYDATTAEKYDVEWEISRWSLVELKSSNLVHARKVWSLAENQPLYALRNKFQWWKAFKN